MTDAVPSQARIAGGQECPGCGETLAVADHFCRWCGAAVREGAPDRVPRSRLDGAHQAISRWKQWATLWFLITVASWVYFIGYSVGWWA